MWSAAALALSAAALFAVVHGCPPREKALLMKCTAPIKPLLSRTDLPSHTTCRLVEDFINCVEAKLTSCRDHIERNHVLDIAYDLKKQYCVGSSRTYTMKATTTTPAPTVSTDEEHFAVCRHMFTRQSPKHLVEGCRYAATFLDCGDRIVGRSPFTLSNFHLHAELLRNRALYWRYCSGGALHNMGVGRRKCPWDLPARLQSCLLPTRAVRAGDAQSLCSLSSDFLPCLSELANGCYHVIALQPMADFLWRTFDLLALTCDQPVDVGGDYYDYYGYETEPSLDPYPPKPQPHNYTNPPMKTAKPRSSKEQTALFTTKSSEIGSIFTNKIERESGNDDVRGLGNNHPLDNHPTGDEFGQKKEENNKGNTKMSGKYKGKEEEIVSADKEMDESTRGSKKPTTEDYNGQTKHRGKGKKPAGRLAVPDKTKPKPEMQSARATNSDGKPEKSVTQMSLEQRHKAKTEKQALGKEFSEETTMPKVLLPPRDKYTEKPLTEEGNYAPESGRENVVSSKAEKMDARETQTEGSTQKLNKGRPKISNEHTEEKATNSYPIDHSPALNDNKLPSFTPRGREETQSSEKTVAVSKEPDTDELDSVGLATVSPEETNGTHQQNEGVSEPPPSQNGTFANAGESWTIKTNTFKITEHTADDEDAGETLSNEPTRTSEPTEKETSETAAEDSSSIDTLRTSQSTDKVTPETVAEDSSSISQRSEHQMAESSTGDASESIHTTMIVQPSHHTAVKDNSLLGKDGQNPSPKLSDFSRYAELRTIGSENINAGYRSRSEAGGGSPLPTDKNSPAPDIPETPSMNDTEDSTHNEERNPASKGKDPADVDTDTNEKQPFKTGPNPTAHENADESTRQPSRHAAGQTPHERADHTTVKSSAKHALSKAASSSSLDETEGVTSHVEKETDHKTSDLDHNQYGDNMAGSSQTKSATSTVTPIEELQPDLVTSSPQAAQDIVHTNDPTLQKGDDQSFAKREQDAENPQVKTEFSKEEDASDQDNESKYGGKDIAENDTKAPTQQAPVGEHDRITSPDAEGDQDNDMKTHDADFGSGKGVEEISGSQPSAQDPSEASPQPKEGALHSPRAENVDDAYLPKEGGDQEGLRLKAKGEKRGQRRKGSNSGEDAPWGPNCSRPWDGQRWCTNIMMDAKLGNNAAECRSLYAYINCLSDLMSACEGFEPFSSITDTLEYVSAQFKVKCRSSRLRQ